MPSPTPNQKTPLIPGRHPLIGLDLGGPPSSLKSQTRRIDYVKAFVNLVNWEFAAERFEKITA